MAAAADSPRLNRSSASAPKNLALGRCAICSAPPRPANGEVDPCHICVLCGGTGSKRSGRQSGRVYACTECGRPSCGWCWKHRESNKCHQSSNVQSLQSWYATSSAASSSASPHVVTSKSAGTPPSRNEWIDRKLWEVPTMLPFGWSSAWSAEKKRWYYYDEKSPMTTRTWLKPPPPPPYDSLPDGWHSIWFREGDVWYYYDEKSPTTSWTRVMPVEPK